MNSAAIGLTKPAAGVMATKPATAPEMAPSALGLPLRTHSAPAHPTTAAAAAKCVATNALVEILAGDRALPTLKPKQPRQRRQAQTNLSKAIWGCSSSGREPRPSQRKCAE